ncbi:hypothetical protein OPV22_028986 [Ensete ventricosum]|uniref:TLC domain-containing protein n=1 Tax=Ensete ventricosum TaxID=4639 RepID=A0AAV8QC68_ENSVE|nr:hypothetical protein OPV22_028986 [Ensete ventricosum]
MALVIRWYDSACLAIVVGAIWASLWTIRRSEGGGRRGVNDRSEYESLLIVVAADGEAELPERRHVGYEQLWMSCWRVVHPALLLVLRLVAMVTMVAIQSWDISTYDSSILVYYTEWTFALVIIYFAIGTVISAHGCWLYSKRYITRDEEANGLFSADGHRNSPVTLPLRTNNNMDTVRLQSYHEQEADDEGAGLWVYSMQLVYQTSAGAVVLTDAIFWVLLVPFLSTAHFELNAIMGCMHTLNAVFLLVDTFLNNLKFPWFRMAYFVLWSCIYAIFQWILHACGFTWWPYPFLELDSAWAPLWYLCMALIHFPCYGLYWLIVRAKHSFFPKFFPNAYVRRRTLY